MRGPLPSREHLSADTTVRENRLGETLVRQGRLTPVDLKRAVGFALRDRKRLGAVLMDFGLLDASALEEAVTIQAHQVLKHVFSWSEGSTSSWRSRQTEFSTATSRSGCRPAS